MPFAQGAQAVQAPALIVILQKLHKAWVADRSACQTRSGPQAFSPVPSLARKLTLIHGERQKLVPELLVHETIWPKFRGKQRKEGEVREPGASASPHPLVN